MLPMYFFHQIISPSYIQCHKCTWSIYKTDSTERNNSNFLGSVSYYSVPMASSNRIEKPAGPEVVTLERLAEHIYTNVEILTSVLRENHLPQPTFNQDGPTHYPKLRECQAARSALAEAAMDLYHLVLGPKDFLVTQAMTVRVPPGNLYSTAQA